MDMQNCPGTTKEETRKTTASLRDLAATVVSSPRMVLMVAMKQPVPIPDFSIPNQSVVAKVIRQELPTHFVLVSTEEYAVGLIEATAGDKAKAQAEAEK